MDKQELLKLYDLDLEELVSYSEKITRENNHCDVECDTNPSGDYFHDETEYDYYTCKKQCDNSDGSKQKIYGNICKNSCENENSQNIYEDDNNQCIKSCQYSINGNIFYSGDSDNYICQNQCSNLIENNKCIDSTGTSYKINEQIVNSCPKTSIFFNNETAMIRSDAKKFQISFNKIHIAHGKKFFIFEILIYSFNFI